MVLTRNQHKTECNSAIIHLIWMVGQINKKERLDERIALFKLVVEYITTHLDVLTLHPQWKILDKTLKSKISSLENDEIFQTYTTTIQ